MELNEIINDKITQLERELDMLRKKLPTVRGGYRTNILMRISKKEYCVDVLYDILNRSIDGERE